MTHAQARATTTSPSFTSTEHAARSASFRSANQLDKGRDFVNREAESMRAMQRMADGSLGVRRLASLQREADSSEASRDSAQTRTRMSASEVHSTAQSGVAGSGDRLPHIERIQRAFGSHDLSHVQAYIGGRARRAGQQIGAQAFATGDKVAFSRAPNLRTAAHEAAHVIQQQAGVQLEGGIGKVGDAYERNADEVAERVVRGQSAQDLLDRFAPQGHGQSHGQGQSGAAVQHKKSLQMTPVVPEINDEEEAAIVDYKGDNYKYFNWFLRGQQLTTRKVQQYGQTKVPALSSALTKMHNSGNYRHTGALYRGDTFAHYDQNTRTAMDTVGQDITIASFMSTSKLKSVGLTYGTDLWKISSNLNGVDIHAAGIAQANEGEVLLPPGSTFRVTTARRKIGAPKIFGGTRKRKLTVTQRS